MSTSHSLENLKYYHQQATQFFASEIMMLKNVQSKITDQRIGQAATLLRSACNTGAALLQLVNQTDIFRSQSVMLARSFMETVINFCYASICDEKEFRAFVLHPVYKQYHNAGNPSMADDLDELQENIKKREDVQAKLREKAIVQEALSIFSATKPGMTWTKKRLGERIQAIEAWGKVLDVFFTISKLEYYSDASEILHGSLYGSTCSIGSFEPGFDPTNSEELSKRTYKESTCMLLHLGILVHEAFTLINYTNDIKETWEHSYHNRGMALNLLFHVIEKKGFEPVLHPSLRQKPDAIIPSHSAGILFEKNRFLLTLHSGSAGLALGFWDGIGGQSLTNEHPIITLQRTILEKTGFQVLNADLLNIADVFRDSNGEVLFKQHLYIVHHFSGDLLHRAEEFSELKWFSRKELESIPIVLPAYIEFIDEWLEKQENG
jgi:hypothetical protein